MIENIEKFISKRPEVIAAYGYGSGIFKQAGYTKKDKPQIDLILVVDDLKKWHKENFKLNRNDYSLIGKIFFKYANISKLKGNTGITYVSNILEDGNIFKYGTIEEKDLIENLNTWKSFYMPGRFEKTIYPIKETKKLKEAIKKNRSAALLVSTYLQKKDIVSKKDILMTLCGLSYLGDTRMGIAENPNKVSNIVEGSFNEFINIYDFNTSYLKENGDNLIIDRKILKKELKQLPKELLEYISDTFDSDDEIIKNRILNYFKEVNHNESSKQTVKGIWTNGIVRSVKYALKKLEKRFKK